MFSVQEIFINKNKTNKIFQNGFCRDRVNIIHLSFVFSLFIVFYLKNKIQNFFLWNKN